MRIAVAGATGRIGQLTVEALERAGHEAVPVSRKAGVDAYTGAGLDAALRGADAVIDATNTPAHDEAEVVDFFGTVTRNLLAAAAAPLRATLDIAGPPTEDLVDMARRTFAARGQDVTLVPTWRGAFGTDMASEVLLPDPDARLTPTTFDDWLAAGAR